MDMTESQKALVGSVQEKVGRWLAELAGSYQVGPDGVPTIRYGSSRIFVKTEPWGEENCIVRIWSILVYGAPKSPELNEWIAYNGSAFFFGSMQLHTLKDDESLANISLEHCILGDFIDPGELREAVMAVTVTSDEQDTELQERFGGTLTHEDSE